MTSPGGREVAVFDYGMGNQQSVLNAFRFLGFKARVVSDAQGIAESERLVFPGVAAFGDCSLSLKKTGAAEAIRDFIQSGRPYLGMCLGLQILFEGSEESHSEPGLGVLKGRVRRFPSRRRGIKIPHMGWNRVFLKRNSPLFKGIEDASWFYFAHSFHVDSDDDSIVAAETEHGVRFTAAVTEKNVFACQFHPEKSSEAGLKILRNFAGFQPSEP